MQGHPQILIGFRGLKGEQVDKAWVNRDFLSVKRQEVGNGADNSSYGFSIFAKNLTTVIINRTFSHPSSCYLRPGGSVLGSGEPRPRGGGRLSPSTSDPPPAN